MEIKLKERTTETVLNYFRATRDAEIQKFLPQKAQSEEEALADFEKTRREGATSYGRTIYADCRHVGDIWCYCIQEEEPNAMVSYCVFDKSLWNRGVATRSLKMFLEEIIEKFHLKHIGAFTYLENIASIRVLEANGFCRVEEFTEDGVASVYLQRNEEHCHADITENG